MDSVLVVNALVAQTPRGTMPRMPRQQRGGGRQPSAFQTSPGVPQPERPPRASLAVAGSAGAAPPPSAPPPAPAMGMAWGPFPPPAPPPAPAMGMAWAATAMAWHGHGMGMASWAATQGTSAKSGAEGTSAKSASLVAKGKASPLEPGALERGALPKAQYVAAGAAGAMPKPGPYCGAPVTPPWRRASGSSRQNSSPMPVPEQRQQPQQEPQPPIPAEAIQWPAAWLEAEEPDYPDETPEQRAAKRARVQELMRLRTYWEELLATMQEEERWGSS